MSHARRGPEAGVIAPRSSEPDRPSPRAGHSTLARIIGGAGMVGLTLLLFWLLTDDAFRVTEANVTFHGLEHAEEAALRADLQGLDRAPNVFRVRASEIVAELSQLPEVVRARAQVTLPAAVAVAIDEREPAFIWSDDDVAWLADSEGMLFAPTTADRVAPDADTLPRVVDRRLPTEAPTIGAHLPATDTWVIRHLLALTPEVVGGRSGELRLQVDQDLGYVLHSDQGWYAVFGHYHPTVQPPEVIPLQVQCLRAVVAQEERRLESVRLAVSDESCGTFARRGG